MGLVTIKNPRKGDEDNYCHIDESTYDPKIHTLIAKGEHPASVTPEHFIPAVVAEGVETDEFPDLSKSNKKSLLEFAAAQEPPIDVSGGSTVAAIRELIETELANRQIAA